MASASIRIENLCKDFHSHGSAATWRALDNVSLKVGSGEFVTILGPSGCGKSTLLNALSGLDNDFAGAVAIEHNGVRANKARVAYLFQEPRLLPWRTVRRNVEFALDAAGFARSEWSDRADKWINLVGLKGFADFYPLQLSGGMQQRAAIARAFSIEPEVLLMDEPFSALDELTARRMRQELLSLWEADRRTVLFVTHNSLEAVYLSDRILIMKRGPGSHVCEEIVLDHLARPRIYEDPAQFETQKSVLQRLMHHVA
jgi:ABC-type nitrate/sulfonate/bicarbonate transport system ATPase subunit